MVKMVQTDSILYTKMLVYRNKIKNKTSWDNN